MPVHGSTSHSSITLSRRRKTLPPLWIATRLRKAACPAAASPPPWALSNCHPQLGRMSVVSLQPRPRPERRRVRGDYCAKAKGAILASASAIQCQFRRPVAVGPPLKSARCNRESRRPDYSVAAYCGCSCDIARLRGRHRWPETLIARRPDADPSCITTLKHLPTDWAASTTDSTHMLVGGGSQRVPARELGDHGLAGVLAQLMTRHATFSDAGGRHAL